MSKIFSRQKMIKLFKRDFLGVYAQRPSIQGLVTKWPKVDQLPAGGVPLISWSPKDQKLRESQRHVPWHGWMQAGENRLGASQWLQVTHCFIGTSRTKCPRNLGRWKGGLSIDTSHSQSYLGRIFLDQSIYYSCFWLKFLCICKSLKRRRWGYF